MRQVSQRSVTENWERAMHFDTLITGGLVVDGTGGAPRLADIGIRGGVIHAIEPGLAALATGGAGETIDAAGRIVTPGFVDVHTHFDGQATWDDLLEPTSPHGVTTVMMGNCGVGFAPVRPTEHQALIELMEGVEDIPGAALAEGLTWGWESFPEYLDVLSKRRWSMDIGAQIAHGPVRRFAMGDDAATNAAATPEQVAIMARVVQEAIEAGAFGFTTSRTLGHKALDGRPVPGTYAALDELQGVAAAVVRGKGRVLEFAASGLARSDVAATVATEFDWLGRLAAETGVNTTFILQQMHTDPDRWRGEMAQAATWRAAGAPVFPLIAGRPFGVLYGWDVRHPFTARPTYRALAHLPLGERLVLLRHQKVRDAILSETDEPTSQAEARQVKYTRTVLPECQIIVGVPDYEQPRSATIGALADLAGATPESIAYDGLLDDGAMLLYALYNYVSYDHSAVYEQFQDADAVLGLADGGAHVGFICDASIPTYILTHWVRDRSRGPRLALADAVRRLTSQPADLYGLSDRGRLGVGLRADLNVINHDQLQLSIPVAVHDLPKGGTRLLQSPTGYDATLVAGQITRRHGLDTGARPGQLLRN
jgi:N-acyl-D-amino-acid deacylase